MITECDMIHPKSVSWMSDNRLNRVFGEAATTAASAPTSNSISSVSRINWQWEWFKLEDSQKKRFIYSQIFFVLSLPWRFLRFEMKKVLKHVSLKMHAKTETQIEFNFCPSTKMVFMCGWTDSQHVNNVCICQPDQNHFESI